ncbi:MAG TPA: adenylate/guanylate cyclase domain-containing protein [Anaerolineales bacterium]|nr:adenylate/guanylate cyclase domain-containing protein [Anaerolineales bacterium]
MTLPSGTVTFLFTDIEGSTKLAQEFPEAMPSLLARHNEILNKAIEAHNGVAFRFVGDSFAVAFHTVQDALNAALDAQRQLYVEKWSPAPIKVRMGIHTGAAQLKEDSNEIVYEGYTTLALTQRIMSAGHGGQILLSQSVYDLTRDVLPETVQLIDMGERQLKDILRVEHIYQLVVSDLPSEFPPLNTFEIFKHNLPPQLTPFIGRAREMEEARKLLPFTRMLTFIGPGGTGKTRLSLQVAMEQFENFKDGVWLVELAPLTDPAYIISTIASIFKLREVQGVSLNDVLMDYLRGKHLLLILDNCEHLVEACAELSERLLYACPNLKIIASSREALGIAGETVYRVPSLSLPPEESPANSLLEFESVQLFVERAARAQSHFHLTEHNAFAVAQICSRLDGIPLAIELAAARVKLFTPEQIAERLDDRFKLLTGGSRTALPRQQTLRALIDWSYQSLNETEQRAFCQLAVFSGGWTFEAAESVLGEEEALDGLQGLVNKSLINVEEQDGKSRYRFLETIRQYAMDKLVEAGDSASARNRHLDYFMDYAASAEEKLAGAERLSGLHVLELEHDNFRSALRWSLDNKPEYALKMVASLAGFWLARGYMREGRSWCQAALDHAATLRHDGGNFDGLRARAFHALALLSINQGEHHAGKAAAQAAITLVRQTGDSLWLARSLIVFGIASAFSGEIEKAFDAFHESESICRQMGNKEELAWVLVSLAYIMFEVQGEAAAQKISAYLEEALALSNESGYPYAYRSNELLARLAYSRGDLAEARRLSENLLTYYSEIGDRLSFKGYQSEMAHTLRKTGNLEEALGLYRETITAWQELGHRGAVAHQLECFAFIAKARGEDERAVKLLSAAEILREIAGSPMMPMERLEYEKELAELRAGIDEKSFASLRAEGRSMSMEKAIEFALEKTHD